MEQPKQYKEKYIAFIDILGFKEAVYSSPQNAERFNEIASALEQLSHIKDILTTAFEALRSSETTDKVVWAKWEDIKITTFSDNIYLSTAKNDVGLITLGAYSCLIYNALFANGFFARGGITKGDIFESDDVVFGNGLIDAYELESKTAIYPRILISDTVIDEIKKLDGFHIKRDFDGLYFLDTFYPNVNKMLENWRKRSSLNLDLSTGREKLILEYNLAKNQSTKSKLYWLIEYFNSKAENHKLQPIKI